MTKLIQLTDKDLIVTPRGLDKVWGFRKQLVIPLDQIRGATADPEIAQECHGLRKPGLHFGKKSVGTFVKEDQKSYWDVNSATRNIVLQLDDSQEFARVILTVADPRKTVQEINDAISRTR